MHQKGKEKLAVIPNKQAGICVSRRMIFYAHITVYKHQNGIIKFYTMKT
jgi:hypothetical protein